MIPDARLQELAALAGEATEGPYHTGDGVDDRRAIRDPSGATVALGCSGGFTGKPRETFRTLSNANYFAALDPTTVAAILAELLAARKVVGIVQDHLHNAPSASWHKRSDPEHKLALPRDQELADALTAYEAATESP